MSELRKEALIKDVTKVSKLESWDEGDLATYTMNIGDEVQKAIDKMMAKTGYVV